MQAVIRSTLGISEEQSRHTSGVHIRLWSSSVKAWLAVGHKARHATTQAASCSPRTHTCRFPIVPSSLTVVAVAFICSLCGPLVGFVTALVCQLLVLNWYYIQLDDHHLTKSYFFLGLVWLFWPGTLKATVFLTLVCWIMV